MSLPIYSSYRRAGVEWLGDVPSHWAVRRVRWLFDIKKRIARELGLDVFSITQDGVRVKDLERNEGQMAMDYSKYQIVEAGDFAMNPMDLLTGGVDIARSRGVTSPDYRVVELRDQSICHGRYFLYLFQTCYRRHIFYGYGQGSAQLGRWRLPTDQFRDFVFPVPPKEEQRAIGAFLDSETAKIDALIAEQRRLMELLKEKRQGVISHAVTKGLNPAALMKPSGVEWLGAIPSHWRVGRCGFYVSILSGFAFPSSDFTTDPNDMRLLRGINVGVGQLRWDDTVYWHRDEGDGLGIFELNLGDIVVGMDRPYISDGMRVASVAQADLPCLLLQRVARLTTNAELDAAYLLHLLSSPMFLAHFEPDTTGVSVPHISPDQIANFVIPIPPVDEQHQITRDIEERVTKFDALTAEAVTAIDLLQERRTALITAAVTGQVDVRGLSAAEVA